MLEFQLIFWLRHNLEGKYGSIPYNQSGFADVRLNDWHLSCPVRIKEAIAGFCQERENKLV